MENAGLSEFADKVAEIWPAIMNEFFKHEAHDFHKIKITLPQCFVLEYLNKSGQSKMGDVAKFLNVSTAALTQVVDRLVRDGYVQRGRDASDRRIIKVKITAKGSKIVNSIMGKRKEMVMRIFGIVSAEEREQYLRILEHIRRHLAGG